MIAGAARLVMPAIRWDEAAGFEPARPAIEQALELGVGGFILFGGELAAVRQLTAELAAASHHPLLIASDLERGAGQQVRGLTPLPPSGALAAIGAEAVDRAARITAAEARHAGITWVLAPVCDLDLEAANPIVQTRSFGADAYDVAHLAARWITACGEAGALACAKHFPGHGRTTADSHAELPVVTAGRELGRDLMPFRRAVAAGVAGVMTAHVAYPAWDASGAPATYSRPILHGVLRGDLFFDGLVVSDALIMEGAKEAGGEEEAARRVIAAGGDLLLYPHDPAAVARGLEGVDVLGPLRRLDAALARVPAPRTLSDAELRAHQEEGRELALRAVRLLRGDVERGRARGVALEIVDDDAGGPYTLPSRDAFGAALQRAGVELRPDGTRVVLLFADVKSWKGRAGLSQASGERLAALLYDPAIVILFGHPRRLIDVFGDGPVVCAWSGDVTMQDAAARWLAHRLA